ncbi:MAG TPA: PHB depolymerase family esterase [Baekduia sp.]|uniref:extracellular catalytic domain type 1 short-chain-length polyhydroxyalkanoate depolymerase n=1 Tax=Baekduia sp. TaxID=2600305 RepID=UPI002BAA0882|nr:PHB depolymerase family esterase [Baekduia sp.]HMJ34295.1 PHB depolymerase family esterase [Baekduia sp.]
MLPYDTDSRMIRGAGPPTNDARRRRARRLRSTWPAAICLVGVLTFALWPTAAGAATGWTVPSWPTWPSLPTIPGLPKLPSLPVGANPTKPTWNPLPVTGGGTTTAPPTSTPTSGQAAGKTFTGTYTGSAGALDYQAYVPSTYKAGTAVPLVVALHGCTETADVFRQLTRWDALAEAKGFIVVFPQQSHSGNNLECWNFFQQAHMARDQGEPALIAGITQWVQQHYTVDPHRIYVNGLSAGGAMASVMAATYPDLYAAAGIGSGCEYAATAACAGYKSADPVAAGQQAYQAMGSHARPMPVILFEGDQDTTVPPVNAQQLVQQWQVTDDYADGGGKDGSVPVQPTAVTHGTSSGGQGYTVTTYSDRDEGELMQSWLVAGMGHAWSGGCGCQQYSDPAGPDETAAMYTFFMAHPMP